MAIQIIRPKFEAGHRIVVISDIYGQFDAFVRLLAEVHYDNREDYLILLGNIAEKGPDGLRTLRYVMELCRSRRVYLVTGDLDPVCREIFRPDRNHELLQYLLRNNSVIRDMCAESGIALNAYANMHAIKLALREYYADELDFICNLPHVLETDNYVFAHSQILPGNLEEMTPAEVMRGEAFLDKGFSFDRYVVVGHWPTLRYPENKRNANPIIQRSRRIVCVDGGMGRLRDGQLNALVIPEYGSDRFTYTAVDNFPKKSALNSQAAGMERHLIQFPDNRVKVLNSSGDMCYCRHEKTEKNYWIPKAFITQTADGTFTEDYTDYQIRVTYGDVVSVILETSRGTLVKKDGVTGWYYGLLK